VSAGRETLSACIIARDEESRLPDCLASVAFCDEIVVVDGGSRDATVTLARAAGAKVVEQGWLGFAAQRNVALDHATGDWVLEIDADERVSPELRAEIESFLGAPPDGVDIGGLPIRQRFLGAPLGRSAKYPDYRHRLFRRGAYRHDERRTVHEGLWPHGPVQPFSGDLEHVLAGSFGEAVRDAWAYARAESAQLRPPGRARAYAEGMLVRPPAKVAFRLTVGGGWRDGWRGVLRIGLEALSDALVWCRALARGRESSAAPAQDAGHFSGVERAGPARLVGVAAGGGAQTLAAWLLRAAGGGADVVLVTDMPDADFGVRVHRLPRLGPLYLARALEAEHQLRPIDALVSAGAADRRRLTLVPAALRGIGLVAPEGDPGEVIARVEAELRRS
jgi:glycosyltransferase involved in cell wall biosynthesis